MRLSVFSAALLFALTVLTLILLRPLMPIDETRYVSAAWEMHEGGSALVPHLNGALYAHKPPLLFWLINLVWLVGGVSDFAARLVSPAFAVAAVALTGLLARRLWPDEPLRAGRAALMLAASPLFLLFGSTTMFDSMLAVASLLALLAIWQALRETGRSAWIALGAAIALGIYAKGPVILIHVLPVALAMPLWAEPATRPALSAWYRGVGLALLVALGLVALWLLPALVLGGEAYRVEILWRQSAGRMVSSFAHRRPFWFFLALLPLMIWPFGWTGPGLRALAPRRLLASAQARFLSIWFLGGLLAFSLISGKQAHYLVPELPALALLMSGALSERKWRKRDLWLALPLFAVALVILLAAGGLLPALEPIDFGEPIWAVLAGFVCLAAGIAAFLYLPGGAVALAALPLALVLGLHFAAQPLLFDRYDVDRIGAALTPYKGQGIAITDELYHAQFNFAARLDQPVELLSNPEELGEWLAQHPGAVVLSRWKTLPAGLKPIARLPYRADEYTLYLSEEARP